VASLSTDISPSGEALADPNTRLAKFLMQVSIIRLSAEDGLAQGIGCISRNVMNGASFCAAFRGISGKAVVELFIRPDGTYQVPGSRWAAFACL